MPASDETTLQKIQREISEVAQREQELKRHYQRSHSATNGHVAHHQDNPMAPNGPTDHNGTAKPPQLYRATSTPHLLATHNGGRLFAANPSIKGVMHRFIKSRGKLPANTNNNHNGPMKGDHADWAPPMAAVEAGGDLLLPPPKMAPGNVPRKNFVPVEVRLKREFQDMQTRETELRHERQKSQPDLMALLDLQASSSPEPERRVLQSARSASHLLDLDEFSDGSASGSGPSSLKPAKSLAELCDTQDESMQSPGSLTLIRQWETIIQKSRQDRT